MFKHNSPLLFKVFFSLDAFLAVLESLALDVILCLPARSLDFFCVFFSSSCPDFWAWCGQNGERIRNPVVLGWLQIIQMEPHVTRQKIGVQITVTLYFIKGKDSQR